jgi:hypothetical protein
MNYPYLLFITIVVFGVIQLLGALVLLFFPESKKLGSDYYVFVRNVIGMLAGAFIVAAVHTSLNTIMTGALFVGILWVVFSGRSNIGLKLNWIAMIEKRGFLSSLTLLGLLIVSFLLIAIIWHNDSEFQMHHFDDSFYAFTAEKLRTLGYETFGPSYPTMKTVPILPYHYFDLWLAVLVKHLSGVQMIVAYSVILKALVYSTAAHGMMVLAKIFSNRVLPILISLSALFIAPILLDYSPVIQNAMIAGNVKLACVAMFLVWSFILAIKGCKGWYFPLLVLPIVTISCAPILLPALLTTTLVLKLRSGFRGAWWHEFVAVIGVTIYVAGFYALNEGQGSLSGTIHDKLLTYYNLDFFLTQTYRLTASYILYLPYFVPTVLLFLFSKKLSFSSMRMWLKLKPELPLLLLFCIFFGFLIVFLFYPFAGVDSLQLNLQTVGLSLAILTPITWLIAGNHLPSKTLRRVNNAFGVIVLFYSVWVFYSSRSHYSCQPIKGLSEEYLAEINQVANATPDQVILGVKYECDGQLFVDGLPSSRTELLNGWGHASFAFMDKFFYWTSLNTTLDLYSGVTVEQFDFSNDKDRYDYFWIQKAKKESLKAPFTQFHKSYKARNPDASIEETQLAFIDSAQARFLIKRKDCKLPDLLEQRVEKVIPKAGNMEFLTINPVGKE